MKKPPRQKTWHRLDNTAHLFPVIASRQTPNVFRLTAVLDETVSPALLQQAVAEVLPYFSAYRVRMRHGFFWNYLERNDADPTVLPETQSPCQLISPFENSRYLFRVIYFENRIHLETFHVLTDGTGASRFLAAICYRYLQLANPALDDGQLHGLEGAGNVQDCYLRLPAALPNAAQNAAQPLQKKREPAAYRLRGAVRFAGDVGVVNLLFSASELKQLCRQKGVTVSVYLASVLLYATAAERLPQSGTKRPLSLFVPVNLRPIFGRDTALNFISNFRVSLACGGVGLSFDEVLQEVNAQFAAKNQPQKHLQQVAFTTKTQQNPILRSVPWTIKGLALRLVYAYSNRSNSFSFSNLGVVKLAPSFAPQVKSVRFHLAPTPKEPVKCTVCTYDDTVAFSLTTLLQENRIAMAVARFFAEQGVTVTVEHNGGDTDEAL